MNHIGLVENIDMEKIQYIIENKYKMEEIHDTSTENVEREALNVENIKIEKIQ